MSKTKINKINTIFIILALALTCVPIQTWAANNVADFTVRQNITINGTGSKPKDTFRYVIEQTKHVSKHSTGQNGEQNTSSSFPNNASKQYFTLKRRRNKNYPKCHSTKQVNTHTKYIN